MKDRQATLARRFRGQADSCAALGSPLYALVLKRAADDLEAGGPTWRVVEPVASLPGGALVALRFLGATHRLALMGLAPGLAAHYPSCGGDGDAEQAWKALVAVAEQHTELTSLLETGVQTNEVGRAAALLGGFLEFARSSARPLRVLEVGASAGLNLRWDRFRYGERWGLPASFVDQGEPWIGDRLPTFQPSTVEIVERAGCDLAPLDPTTTEGRLTLLSFVWPDMARRFTLLEGACQVAAEVPAVVDQASADEWIAPKLADGGPGVATIIFHSVFLQYVGPPARARLLESIASFGAATTEPFAWLRLEPPGPLGSQDFEVRLTTWPGGEDRRLAWCHPHGSWVRWEQ